MKGKKGKSHGTGPSSFPVSSKHANVDKRYSGPSAHASNQSPNLRSRRDTLEVQTNEVEALKCIYMDDFTGSINSNFDYNELRMSLSSSGNISNLSSSRELSRGSRLKIRDLKLVLLFTIDNQYPYSLPKITIDFSQGITKMHEQALLDLLVQKSQTMKGTEMLFDLVETAKEYLVSTERRSKSVSFYDRMVERHTTEEAQQLLLAKEQAMIESEYQNRRIRDTMEKLRESLRLELGISGTSSPSVDSNEEVSSEEELSSSDPNYVNDIDIEPDHGSPTIPSSDDYKLSLISGLSLLDPTLVIDDVPSILHLDTNEEFNLDFKSSSIIIKGIDLIPVAAMPGLFAGYISNTAVCKQLSFNVLVVPSCLHYTLEKCFINDASLRNFLGLSTILRRNGNVYYISVSLDFSESVLLSVLLSVSGGFMNEKVKQILKKSLEMLLRALPSYREFWLLFLRFRDHLYLQTNEGRLHFDTLPSLFIILKKLETHPIADLFHSGSLSNLFLDLHGENRILALDSDVLSILQGLDNKWDSTTVGNLLQFHPFFSEKSPGINPIKQNVFNSKISNAPAKSPHTDLVRKDTLRPIPAVSSATDPAMHSIHSRYRYDFQELSYLGHGAFGQVVQAMHRVDGRIYAIKKIKLSKSGSFQDDGFSSAGTPSDEANSTKKILREVHALSRLQHSNIVRYYQAWIEGNTQNPEDDDSNSEDTGESDSRTSTTSLSTSPSSLLFPIVSSANADNIDKEILRNENFHSRETSYIEFVKSSNDTASLSSVLSGADSSSHEKRQEFTTSSNPRKSFKNRLRSPEPASTLFIQMEYCSPFTLRDLIDYQKLSVPLISHRSQITLSSLQNCITHFKTIFKLMRQLTQGLEHLHKMGIVHRDMKPGNIFVKIIDSNNYANILAESPNIGQNPSNLLDCSNVILKIGDFGLAAITNISSKSSINETSADLNIIQDAVQDSGDKPLRKSASFTMIKPPSFATNSQPGAGTPLYSAPETSCNDPNSVFKLDTRQSQSLRISTKVDMYAMGLILFELVHAPFNTLMEKMHILEVLKQSQGQTLPSAMQSTKSLIEEVLQGLISQQQQSQHKRNVNIGTSSTKNKRRGGKPLQQADSSHPNSLMALLEECVYYWNTFFDLLGGLLRVQPSERPSAKELLSGKGQHQRSNVQKLSSSEEKNNESLVPLRSITLPPSEMTSSLSSSLLDTARIAQLITSLLGHLDLQGSNVLGQGTYGPSHIKGREMLLDALFKGHGCLDVADQQITAEIMSSSDPVDILEHVHSNLLQDLPFYEEGDLSSHRDELPLFDRVSSRTALSSFYSNRFSASLISILLHQNQVIPSSELRALPESLSEDEFIHWFSYKLLSPSGQVLILRYCLLSSWEDREERHSWREWLIESSNLDGGFSSSKLKSLSNSSLEQILPRMPIYFMNYLPNNSNLNLPPLAAYHGLFTLRSPPLLSNSLSDGSVPKMDKIGGWTALTSALLFSVASLDPFVLFPYKSVDSIRPTLSLHWQALLDFLLSSLSLSYADILLMLYPDRFIDSAISSHSLYKNRAKKFTSSAVNIGINSGTLNIVVSKDSRLLSLLQKHHSTAVEMVLAVEAYLGSVENIGKKSIQSDSLFSLFKITAYMLDCLLQFLPSCFLDSVPNFINLPFPKKYIQSKVSTKRIFWQLIDERALNLSSRREDFISSGKEAHPIISSASYSLPKLLESVFWKLFGLRDEQGISNAGSNVTSPNISSSKKALSLGDCVAVGGCSSLAGAETLCKSASTSIKDFQSDLDNSCKIWFVEWNASSLSLAKGSLYCNLLSETKVSKSRSPLLLFMSTSLLPLQDDDSPFRSHRLSNDWILAILLSKFSSIFGQRVSILPFSDGHIYGSIYSPEMNPFIVITLLSPDSVLAECQSLYKTASIFASTVSPDVSTTYPVPQFPSFSKKLEKIVNFRIEYINEARQDLPQKVHVNTTTSSPVTSDDNYVLFEGSIEQFLNSHEILKHFQNI